MPYLDDPILNELRRRGILPPGGPDLAAPPDPQAPMPEAPPAESFDPMAEWVGQQKAALGGAMEKDKDEQEKEDRRALLMQFANSYANRRPLPQPRRDMNDNLKGFVTGLGVDRTALDFASHILATKKGAAGNPDNEPAPPEWGAPAGMSKKQAIDSGFAKKEKGEVPADVLEPELLDRAKKAGVPTSGRKREPVIADILAAERAGAERDKADAKDRKTGGADQVKTEIELRREFIGQKGYQDFQTVSAAAEKVKSASSSGAGDIALVYGFMKLTDPGSTVREGEFATAASAGSAPERAVAWYNKALRGERLPPEVRGQFKTEADKILAAQRIRYQRLAGQYRDLAKRYGVDPERVVFEPGGDPETATTAADPMGIR